MSENKQLIIGLDFDGTLVKHKFPEVGEDIGAQRVLRRLVEAGHKLVLFTMRSNTVSATTTDPTIQGVSGNHLDAAVKWFTDNDIPLWGINENPEQKSWTSSPKAYCHLYIDDAALGVPLKMDAGDDRPYVDWIGVEYSLESKNILEHTELLNRGCVVIPGKGIVVLDKDKRQRIMDGSWLDAPRCWISVEDSIPSTLTSVLVSTDRGIGIGHINKDSVWFVGGFASLRRITHWMPLPAAPKQ